MFLIKGYGFALAMGLYFTGMFAALNFFGEGLDEAGQIRLILVAHALLILLDAAILAWLNRRQTRHIVCGVPAQFFMIVLGAIMAGVLWWSFGSLLG